MPFQSRLCSSDRGVTSCCSVELCSGVESFWLSMTTAISRDEAKDLSSCELISVFAHNRFL